MPELIENSEIEGVKVLFLNRENLLEENKNILIKMIKRHHLNRSSLSDLLKADLVIIKGRSEMKILKSRYILYVE